MTQCLNSADVDPAPNSGRLEYPDAFVFDSLTARQDHEEPLPLPAKSAFDTGVHSQTSASRTPPPIFVLEVFLLKRAPRYSPNRVFLR